jgi:hypothetical protein
MTLRAVIAGATGLIGSNLAEYLLSKSWVRSWTCLPACEESGSSRLDGEVRGVGIPRPSKQIDY